MGMKSITLTRGDEQITFACNSEGEGLFEWDEQRGSYHQILGTCQTPVFRTPEQLRRFVGRRLSERGWRWSGLERHQEYQWL